MSNPAPDSFPSATLQDYCNPDLGVPYPARDAASRDFQDAMAAMAAVVPLQRPPFDQHAILRDTAAALGIPENIYTGDAVEAGGITREMMREAARLLPAAETARVNREVGLTRRQLELLNDEAAQRRERFLENTLTDMVRLLEERWAAHTGNPVLFSRRQRIREACHTCLTSLSQFLPPITQQVPDPSLSRFNGGWGHDAIQHVRTAGIAAEAAWQNEIAAGAPPFMAEHLPVSDQPIRGISSNAVIIDEVQDAPDAANDFSWLAEFDNSPTDDFVDYNLWIQSRGFRAHLPLFRAWQSIADNPNIADTGLADFWYNLTTGSDHSHRYLRWYLSHYSETLNLLEPALKRSMRLAMEYRLSRLDIQPVMINTYQIEERIELTAVIARLTADALTTPPPPTRAERAAAAVDAINDFTRERMQVSSFMRQVMPPVLVDERAEFSTGFMAQIVAELAEFRVKQQLPIPECGYKPLRSINIDGDGSYLPSEESPVT